MSRFLLDTMIVSYFLESSHEAWLEAASKIYPMVIVREVHQELRNHRHRGSSAFDRWFSRSSIEVHDIVVGTAAASTLGHLVIQTSPRKGLGERASIAVAAQDPSLTFVTHDRGAAWIALHEMWSPGERLLSVTGFLRRSVEVKSLLDTNMLDDVMSLAFVGNARRPTWWASWRAGL